MSSSVGENVPPDRGRSSLDSEMDDLSLILNSPVKASQKRPAEDVLSVPEKRSAPHLPAAASNQHTYTRPGFDNNSVLNYSETDSGPFVVHVSRSDGDFAPVSNHTRTLKIAQIIYNGKISGIDEIKNMGRNRAAIIFKTYNEANSFLTNPLLSSNKLSAIIPRFQVTRMGVVRQIPVEWSLEDLVSWIECRSVSTTVIKARRMNKKKKIDGKTVWEPTGTVVLSFLGQVLPKHVYCCSVSLPVNIYTLPTIQCLKCCRFGHIRDQCRSQARCSRCAGPHEGNSCSVSENNITCLFCSGCHPASDPKCPEHARQRSIKMVMSEENISYIEAARRFPSVRTSYADVANSSLPQKPIFLSRSAPSSNTLPSSSPSSSRHTPSTSYKKTVFIEKSSKPILSKSYDRHAHNNIISPPNSCLPNGCALSTPTPCAPATNDNLAELMSMLLLNILSKFNDILPNNVLIQIHALISSLVNSQPKHNDEGPTMELS